MVRSCKVFLWIRFCGERWNFVSNYRGELKVEFFLDEIIILVKSLIGILKWIFNKKYLGKLLLVFWYFRNSEIISGCCLKL